MTDVVDQRSAASPPAETAVRQITIRLPREWFLHLNKLAREAGKTPNACARSLLIDVLRDDAIAHGEGGG